MSTDLSQLSHFERSSPSRCTQDMTFRGLPRFLFGPSAISQPYHRSSRRHQELSEAFVFVFIPLRGQIPPIGRQKGHPAEAGQSESRHELSCRQASFFREQT